MTLDDLRAISPTEHSTSAHDTSLVTALDTAQELGYQIPEEFIIYAVEVENILEFSETPTPAVAAAIPKVVELIFKELNLVEIQQPQG
jgi:hydrogenase maturation protease